MREGQITRCSTGPVSIGTTSKSSSSTPSMCTNLFSMAGVLVSKSNNACPAPLGAACSATEMVSSKGAWRNSCHTQSEQSMSSGFSSETLHGDSRCCKASNSPNQSSSILKTGNSVWSSPPFATRQDRMTSTLRLTFFFARSITGSRSVATTSQPSAEATRPDSGNPPQPRTRAVPRVAPLASCIARNSAMTRSLYQRTPPVPRSPHMVLCSMVNSIRGFEPICTVTSSRYSGLQAAMTPPMTNFGLVPLSTSASLSDSASIAGHQRCTCASLRSNGTMPPHLLHMKDSWWLPEADISAMSCLRVAKGNPR
mmetsp:Transcript_36970/g.98499  ORF Transcript_36970/g.98499 Transcript_36970/m.98499 type:complete len:311 (-) Transcript_36970:69-1001(-)